MRAITALRKNLSLSSIGGTFDEGPFWSRPPILGSAVSEREKIANDFEGYVEGAMKSSGVVMTCLLIRQYLFSEARFQFQQLRGGRPGDLFGNAELQLLEEPWPNGTTGELLSRMEQDVSLAGNFFATTVTEGGQKRVRRLRPDWVTIVTGSSTESPFALDARPVAYVYEPNRGFGGEDKTILTPDEVVHWSPIPDPTHQWRGMSWITAITREVEADKNATAHKAKFFDNGAVSNLIITYDADLARDRVEEHANYFQEQYAGGGNAYKTIHLGGGADAKGVGADMKQLDFKVTQGAGESRIAAASLVGAVMAQFSEGMQGSSLNAGNFESARRRFADVWARPQWRSAAAALQKLVEVPSGARLWYDDRDIPFLQQDEQDAAEILETNARTVRTLTDAGYEAESVIAAVQAQDMSLLDHSGLFSVQLQPPGSDESMQVNLTSAEQLRKMVDDGWTMANGHKQHAEV